MTFTPAPELAKDGYATCTVETVIDIPADTFFDWYLFEPVESFMVGSVMVPAIIATQPLESPAWPQPGSTRKYTFKDGTVALEHIVSTNLPRSYSYQAWAYDNPVRFLSDHAKATMSALPEGNKTRVVWEYGFHARQSWMVPLLQIFVSLDWTRNLNNGLKVLKSHLETHGTSHHIDDVKRAA
jgi:hypothetical protein